MRKHIPQRSCIVCRLKVAKDELLRIVRCPDGTLSLDLSGRLPGRGAYVCDSVKCWETAVDRGAIQRALNVPVGRPVRYAINSVPSSGTLLCGVGVS